uniref:Uncharacterized protein n=1 Tax=Myotis myotis TaxID=51298 RepID=A0A7J7ZWN9_MYOMY|nr:hypothetical protein mMyoMyo1_009601 [Myotis myotis]
MQIKTTMRYHPTPVRMIPSIHQQTTSVGKGVEKREPGALLGMQIGAATVEDSMEFPYDPASPLLGIYPKKRETLIRKNIRTPLFIAVLFTIVKTWKKSMCHQLMSGQECYGTFTQWNTTRP